MAFSSRVAVATAAAKQGMGLLLLTAFFFVMLSSYNGASAVRVFDNTNLDLPADIPAARANITCGKGIFTDLPAALTSFCGKGIFTDFLVDLLLGVGDQEYTYDGTTWVNTDVTADLYDSNFTKVSHHFFRGGVATWAAIDSQSQVTAVPEVEIPQKTAVSLFLFHTTFNSGAKTSSHDFGTVTHVQQLQTSKGLPPKTAGTTGEIFTSSYTAIYAFYSVP